MGERDETCPVSTEGWTRRVHFVREGGGGGGRLVPRGLEHDHVANAPARRPRAARARDARAGREQQSARVAERGSLRRGVSD